MEFSSPAARDPDDWWWVFDPRQSLRARAVLIFGGLALAFTLLLGWTAEALFRRQLSRQLGPAFETLALQIGDKLDRALDDRLRAMQLTAGLTAMRATDTPVAERRAALEALLTAAPDCAWLGFADRDGRVIAGTQHWFEGTAVETSAWFRGARRQAFAGNVHEFPELAREFPNSPDEHPRFLDLGVPVTDAGGKFSGVLGAQLPWLWARDLQRSVVSDLARREHIGVSIYAPTGEALLDSGATSWTEPPDAPAVGDKAGAHGNFVERVPGDGDYVTGYVRTKGFREFRGANWLIAVRQPAADAFAVVGDLRRTIFRAGFAFTAIVIVLSWLVAGRIVRRMAAVTSAATRIRHGDILTLMPQPPGRGEVQNMCGALGEMVDDFRAQQEKSDARPPNPPPRKPDSIHDAKS